MMTLLVISDGDHQSRILLELAMKSPSFDKINESKHSGKVLFAGARAIHSNPSWFKYYWWLFTAESPVDGLQFLSDEYRLNFSEFEKELARIKAQGLEVWVYNIKLHRIGTHSPFDEQKLRDKGIIQFAPSFENDPDPLSSEGYR